jgi:hypothetical protein
MQDLVRFKCLRVQVKVSQPTNPAKKQTVKAQRHLPINPSCWTRMSSVATYKFKEGHGPGRIRRDYSRSLRHWHAAAGGPPAPVSSDSPPTLAGPGAAPGEEAAFAMRGPEWLATAARRGRLRTSGDAGTGQSLRCATVTGRRGQSWRCGSWPRQPSADGSGGPEPNRAPARQLGVDAQSAAALCGPARPALGRWSVRTVFYFCDGLAATVRPEPGVSCPGGSEDTSRRVYARLHFSTKLAASPIE